MMHLVMKDSKRRKSILDRDWNEEERKHEAAKIITRTLRRHSQNKSREADAFKGRFSAGKQNRKGRFHCPLLNSAGPMISTFKSRSPRRWLEASLVSGVE